MTSSPCLRALSTKNLHTSQQVDRECAACLELLWAKVLCIGAAIDCLQATLNFTTPEAQDKEKVLAYAHMAGMLKLNTVL